MLRQTYRIVLILVVLLAWQLPLELWAQCAMCKAVPASNHAQGGKVGAGLNTGIMYLLIIPYVILVLGAYFFFKQSINAKIKQFLKRQ